MNEQEYNDWRADALAALLAIYSEEDANTVLVWFDSIKGSEERELVGDACVDAMCEASWLSTEHALYRSMMARVFVYAPLILRM